MRLKLTDKFTHLLQRISNQISSAGAINAPKLLTNIARRIKTAVYVDIPGPKTTLRNGNPMLPRADARPILRLLKSRISIGVTIAMPSRTKTVARTTNAAFAAGHGPRMTAISGDPRILYVAAEQKSASLPRKSSRGVTTVRI